MLYLFNKTSHGRVKQKTLKSSSFTFKMSDVNGEESRVNENEDDKQFQKVKIMANWNLGKYQLGQLGNTEKSREI